MFLKSCTSIINIYFRGFSLTTTHFNIRVSAYSFLQIICNQQVKSNYFSSWMGYVANENAFAHNIMTELPNKYSIAKKLVTVDLEKSLQNKIEKDYSVQDELNPSEIGDRFMILSERACNHNTDISSTVASHFNALKANLPKVNDVQLESVFTTIGKWPNTDLIKSRIFIDFCRELDSILITRMAGWSTDKLLLFSDYVYNTDLCKQFKYTSFALNTLGARAIHLTTAQLVQTLFYVGASRSHPPNIHNLEKRLLQCLHSLTIDEIAICCMGFFKSKARLKDFTLVDKLMERVTSEADSVNDITLSAILKLIRYSSQRQNIKTVFMLDSLIKQVPRLSFLACVHIALVGTTSLTVHRESIAAVEKKLIGSPTSARLKDLERLTYAFSTFKLETDSSLNEIIVNQLKDPNKEDEIKRYGTCLVNCLSYLAINGVFPEDLINKVLHNDFITQCYRKSIASQRALIVIDASIEIECEDYRGNRLDETRKNMLATEIAECIPEAKDLQKLNFNQKYMLEVLTAIEQMVGGKKYLYAGHLLPHFSRGDIVISSDINGRLVKVEEHLFKATVGSIVRPPNSSSRWFAFVIAGRHCFTSNTRELLAGPQMKLRQLSKIGYTPILVSWIEWRILKTQENKKKYLKYITKDLNLRL